MALFVVAVVFCAGIAVTNIKSNDIPLHDGDVLVDSQAACTDDQEKTDEQGDAKSFEQQKADLELKRQEVDLSLE